MPQLDFSVSSDVVRTPRVMQVEALFDAPAEEKLTREWHMTVPLEEQPWQIGLIVGPSGSGKSTTARHMFGDLATITHEWSPTGALVDDFPAEISIKDVTKLLGSVGLGTVPAWLRPYSTLSTGEQFRADVAHALAVHPDLAVIDEWTSTVDRHVAQVASHTAAKTVRRRGGQLVAVTCHYDVLDWLQPDWILEPHTGDFTWRSVQPRPHIDVDVYPVDRAAWRVFAPFHYLSARMPNGGEPFGAFIDGQCVGFALVAGTPHRAASAKKIRRTRRLVVLPDWQGLGIGIRSRRRDTCTR